MIKLMIVGAAGRMGKEVIRACSESHDLEIASAIESGSHPETGKDCGLAAGVEAAGAKIGNNIAGELEAVDGVIDFSLPESTSKLFNALLLRPKPAVVGTTGLDDKILGLAKEVSGKAPLLIAPNLSYGVAVLRYLARGAMKFLSGFDVEIMEIHHRNKVDAPSGTASAILDVIADAVGSKGAGNVLHGRRGKDTKRKEGEIGVHAVRGGSVTGEHTIFFLGNGERIEIRHIAENRKIFVLGALSAIRWLKNQPPGLYTMDDIFK